MSNRFKSLASDSKEKDKKKVENKEKDNIFKNRFNILNEKDDIKHNNNKKTDNNVKKEKNTRFDSLLIDEEVKEESKETLIISSNNSFKSALFKKKEEPVIEEPVIKVEEPIVFDSLVSKNIVTTTSNTTLNFKDKLTTINTEPKVKKVEQKQVPVAEVKNDLEIQKAKQEKKERKEATIVMSKIITQMVANGERQKRFYDSIYGAGAYDANYERIIDKYEVIYGKDSWFADGEEYHYINDYDIDSDEQYNSDEYDYTNETINDANNRYKWL